MKAAKKDQPKNRVYIECSETTRRVKATVLDYSDKQILVELPTGFQMAMTKKRRRSPYVWRIGMLEFLSDGKLVN
jgi:hypothetical protein